MPSAAAAAPRRGRKRAAQRRSLAFFAQLTDPADRRRDVPGPGRLRRRRRRGAEVRAAPAGGARDADVRRDRAQRERQPAQPGQRTRKGSRARGSASRSPPATWPTTSSSTRRAGSARCSTAAASTRSPAKPWRRQPVRHGHRPTTLARINADVAARRYTGAAGLRRLARRAADRYAGYWDPDEARARRRAARGVPPLPRPDGARAGRRSGGRARCARGTSRAATTTA